MTPIAVVLISLLLSMKDILHLFLVFLLINEFEEVNVYLVPANSQFRLILSLNAFQIHCSIVN